MGTTFGKPFSGLFQETEPRIVFFGLNYSEDPLQKKDLIIHTAPTQNRRHPF
uniref:Uncharacterized protein n=1 Tax=Brassica oleracea TaxID=3712 RepID=A0A3P6FE35_BRAOL|nr:unnamed protein product [Brassica oleracea]